VECIGDLGTAAAGVDVGSGLQRLCWMGSWPIRQIGGEESESAYDWRYPVGYFHGVWTGEALVDYI